MVHLEVVAAAVTTSSPQGKSSEDILCFYAPVLRTDLKEHEGEIKVIPFPPWSVVKLKKQYNVGRTSAEVKVELKHYKTMNSLNDSNLCLQLDLRVTLSKLSDQPRFCEEIQAVGKYPQDLRDTQNAIAAMQKNVNDVCCQLHLWVACQFNGEDDTKDNGNLRSCRIA